MTTKRDAFEKAYCEYHGHDLEAFKRRRRGVIYDMAEITDAYRWWLKAQGEDIPTATEIRKAADLDTAIRGVLQDEFAAVEGKTPEECRETLREILLGMGRVDSKITKSLYDWTLDGRSDVPPDGDSYNDLWGAVASAIQWGGKTRKAQPAATGH